MPPVSESNDLSQGRIVPAPGETPQPSTATDTDSTLAAWSQQLVAALEISDLVVDVDAVLDLAADAAHAVLRPAAPLTTFVVGYAAGLAAAGGGSSADAVRSAIAVARHLCEAEASSEPDMP